MFQLDAIQIGPSDGFERKNRMAIIPNQLHIEI
jgi:hypothetical protein